MAAKLSYFPGTKGGDATPAERSPHIIRCRLDEMQKDIRWLAGEMRVTPRTIQNHMAGRSELKGRNFARLLSLLEIDLNYYYRVGKYARPGNRQPHGPHSLTNRNNFGNTSDSDNLNNDDL